MARKKMSNLQVVKTQDDRKALRQRERRIKRRRRKELLTYIILIAMAICGTLYAHCVSVADTACVLAETLHLRVNERALIRGALLHDYFLYDWHDKANGHHWHGFTHPGTALHNASEDWRLTPVEREIIKKHMFPLTPIPPTCREAWLVCLADKICAAKETTGGIYGKLPFAAKHNAQDK